MLLLLLSTRSRITIIPYTSNHPTQQKYAAIRFLYNRLNTYQLHNEEYHQEENIIHNILYNNSFSIHPQKPSNLKQNQIQYSPTLKHKWATFIYIGKETTYVTNIFKHSDKNTLPYKTSWHTKPTTLTNSHLQEFIN